MNVLITGANRGIGKALFDTYQASGAMVTGTHRSGDAEGRNCQALDVTDPISHKAMAERLGGVPIDLLVCNAGVYLDKGQSLDEGYAADLWAQQFAVNVTGVFLTIQSLLPNIRASKNGKIAIISSIMATQENAPGGGYIYRSSKAAALNLGRNLAVDLKPEGIPVGIYHPGWVQTDMGGSQAAITVDQSASSLAERFKALTIETTGCFEAYDGTPLPF